MNLREHDERYAEAMSALTSQPAVKEALGLPDDMVTVEGAKKFIWHVTTDERQYSRAIFDGDTLIGVITLKDISAESAHIGTWLGEQYWGLGYNEEAKSAVLAYAFNVLELKRVFAGAAKRNIRSLKAQEKLGYVTMDVGKQYPIDLITIEKVTGEPCQLNVITRENFLAQVAKK